MAPSTSREIKTRDVELRRKGFFNGSIRINLLYYFFYIKVDLFRNYYLFFLCFSVLLTKNLTLTIVVTFGGKFKFGTS